MDFLKHHHHRHHSSATSHRSISDTDSQLDEFHSPLRADSPLRSDDIISSTSTSTAIVTVDKFRSPIRSPLSGTVNVAPLAKSPSPAVTYNRPAKNEVVIGGTVMSGSGGDAGVRGGDGDVKRSRVPVASVVRRPLSEVTVERVALGFRVCEMIFCLIAFSVMVSDKTQGWSGDSFDRYMEYKCLVAVNVIALTYAALQAVDHTYLLVYGRHVVIYSLRCHFDFLIDQILAYLLISSSSSAATRVDDWVLNWGKDEFTKMASVSVVMSFLAFLGFAFSSIISGYYVCDQNPI